MKQSDSMQKITVLGSGRWGTAMAIFLSRKGYDVTLQCHLKEEYEQLKSTDRAPNLPQFSCEGKIQFCLDLNESLQQVDLIVISTPVPFLRSLLERIENLSTDVVLVSINKGIEQSTLETVPEIIREYFPDNPIAHLGGPCFPEGLLSEITPVAETIACEDETLGKELQELFSSPVFRVYRSKDLKGVAVLGALKNIYAIVAGIADGQEMFEEVIAVLVTRGLVEMKRFCKEYGVCPDTVYGLSGLGDLALTCYSLKNSHNKNFGRRLGHGEKVEDILASMEGKVAEGYFTTKAVWNIAQQKGIDLPICNMVYHIIYENKSIREGLAELMSRPLKEED